MSQSLEQLGGVVTVAAGVYDMRRAILQQEVHNLVHQHMKVGFALLAAITTLTVRRWTVHMKPEYPVSAIYLAFAVLTMGLAAFQGWLGGELVYSRGVLVKHAPSGAGSDTNPRMRKASSLTLRVARPPMSFQPDGSTRADSAAVPPLKNDFMLIQPTRQLR